MKLFADLVNHSIYRGELPPRPAGYDYLLAGNGLFKRVYGDHLTACLPIAPYRVRGLPNLTGVAALAHGRIPTTLLHHVLLDAREKAQQQVEQTYLFRWDGNRYRVSRPAQQVNSVRVQSFSTQGYDNVVCELHSHHTMPAFFSSIDDSDEQGFRFYAVIGRLLTEPEIRVRVGLYGDMVNVPADSIFSDLLGVKDKFVQNLHGLHGER